MEGSGGHNSVKWLVVVTGTNVNTHNDKNLPPKSVLWPDRCVFIALVMFDMLRGAAALMWDRARAGRRTHRGRNGVEKVPRELKYGTKGTKRQGKVKRDEHAHSVCG